MSKANEVAAGLVGGVVSAFNVAAAPMPDLSNTDFYADKPVAGLVESVADMAEADKDAREQESEVDYEGVPSPESAEHRDPDAESTVGEEADSPDLDAEVAEAESEVGEGDADAQAAADALDADLGDQEADTAGELSGDGDADAMDAAADLDSGDLDGDVDAADFGDAGDSAGDGSGDAGDAGGDGGF
ncbi:hypothetical protein [Blastococcus deserti]|uniref:Uncharacterized protein n=1 Tax=Blastococcus deserti TaxID=2259033 RepID=A0ABW4X5V0_9ACTN